MKPYNRLHPPKRRKPRLVPKPNYRGKAVIAIHETGAVAMAAGLAAQQVARSKGGRRIHELGKAHQFTSETARAAALKLWRTRQRKVKGVRVGMRRNVAPRTNRKDLRLIYAIGNCEPESPAWYDPFEQQWFAWTREFPISERTALRRLGHLPYRNRKGIVPERVVQATGVLPALRKKRDNNS